MVPCFVVAAVFLFVRSQLQIFSVFQIVVVVVVLACFVFCLCSDFLLALLGLLCLFSLESPLFDKSMIVSVSLFNSL